MSELEEATRHALTSMPELAINDWEIDLVPVLRPDDFDGEVTRINVDLWERAERTKEALQEPCDATRPGLPDGRRRRQASEGRDQTV